MKYCNKCNVSVNVPARRCPLCHATLVRKNEEPEILHYPPLTVREEKYSLIIRVLLFLSLSAGVVCLTVNLLTYNGFPWSLIVIANILYMWATVSTAVRRHRRIGYVLLIETICLAALFVALDLITQSGLNWAFNFALPGLFVAATLSITIVVIARRMAIRDFILYFFLIALTGFVPLVLLATGLSTVRWPAVSCALYSGLSLLSIFIFADRTTRIELKKRFHI